MPCGYPENNIRDKLHKENVLGFFYGMAKKTGTLWELMDPVASCNHGFASHVAVWISVMDV